MRREELDPALTLVVERMRAYLAELDDLPLHGERYEETAWSFDGPLPEDGAGAEATLRRLTGEGLEAAVASSGPRSSTS